MLQEKISQEHNICSQCEGPWTMCVKTSPNRKVSAQLLQKSGFEKQTQENVQWINVGEFWGMSPPR